MNLTIRQETQLDYPLVFEIIEKAFADDPYGDHNEQFLVERLRKSDAFIPELSMVATLDKTVVGHILITRIKIKNEFQEFDSIALAPVSVLPEYQGKGIGGKLIEAAHQKAKELGHHSIVLIGHETYYPRFGYHRASEFNIKVPFEVPDENCMAIELVPGALNKVSGTVVYPEAFFETL